MTYRLALVLAPTLVLAACAGPVQAPVSRAPTTASPDSFASLDSPPPAPLPERVDAPAPDAQALLVASAMSFLGKTTAEYDGMSMVIVEHDPAELLDEAFADRSFCELVAAADVEPHDGVLTPSEAQHLELSVLASL
ncbi:MAG: hypothetical protein ACRBN8_01775 [Nannocystales bacterium]